MELEWCSVGKANQWTLTQPRKVEMDVIGSIMDLTWDLSQQKTAVSNVVSLAILEGSARLEHRLSRINGIGSDISLGAIKTLSKAQEINQEIMALEAKFVSRLWESRMELNRCLIHLQQRVARLPQNLLPP